MLVKILLFLIKIWFKDIFIKKRISVEKKFDYKKIGSIFCLQHFFWSSTLLLTSSSTLLSTSLLTLENICWWLQLLLDLTTTTTGSLWWWVGGLAMAAMSNLMLGWVLTIYKKKLPKTWRRKNVTKPALKIAYIQPLTNRILFADQTVVVARVLNYCACAVWICSTEPSYIIVICFR